MTAMSVLIKFIVKLLFLVSGILTLALRSKQKALCEVVQEFYYDLNTLGLTGFAYFVPKIKQVFKGNSDKSQNQFAHFHSEIKITYGMIHGHVFVQAFLLVCSIITFVANISFVTLVVFSSEKKQNVEFTKIELNTECLVIITVDLINNKSYL